MNNSSLSDQWKVEQWEGDDFIVTGFGFQHPGVFRRREADMICSILKAATPFIENAVKVRQYNKLISK